MHALLVIDAQNEFSKNGKRPVPNHLEAAKRIADRVTLARRENYPIAWIRHFNRPYESKAFEPGTWGSEFYAGLGPKPGNDLEKEFHKDVYGAFAGTDVGIWLEELQIKSLVIVGFYTHACVSTTAREALMMNFEVAVDYFGTGSCDMYHQWLGHLTADEVRNSALLQLDHMGANIIRELGESTTLKSKGTVINLPVK